MRATRRSAISSAIAAVVAALSGTPTARATLPIATGRSFNLAEPGYTLWIPNNYVQRGSQADLLIQYLGDNTFMRNNLAYSNLNAILLTVNIGADQAHIRRHIRTIRICSPTSTTRR